VARFTPPAALRHPVALVGMVIAVSMALLFVILLAVELLGFVTNPYAGLLLFAAVPLALVAGLILVGIGLRLDGRRRRREPGAAPPDWPVLDLRLPRQRRLFAAILALTAVNLMVLSMASYSAVHYMESTEFCGQVCHTTMEPQYVAHRSGPHARVACVACHVGPGLGALVESKLAGTRQLWQVATGNVPTPVPSPVHNLRPARYTCEQCHWPEKFHGDRVHVFTEFGDDEASTESSSLMTMFVGGGSAELGVGTGIHWHMNLDNEIEYITTDPQREVIPWVQLRDRAGNVREYVAPGTTPEMLEAGERRRMDCMDCHNRPAHTFYATPERAVDAAIVQGVIPRDLPYARREAVAAVSPEYPDRDAALAAIAARLRDHYREDPSVDPRLVERAIAGAQVVWSTNVFPAMNVRWGTYPNHIGHIDFPGCFRCHTDEHEAPDGSVIRQDCELCHNDS
jgi:hypothetical protein